MLQLEIIRESHSPYSLSVVVVRRRSVPKRVFADYQKLNKLTVCDVELMTKVVHLIHNLRNDRFFTKVDLSKGYWQGGPVAPGDIHRTAPSTPDEVYEFRYMPFAIDNLG